MDSNATKDSVSESTISNMRALYEDVGNAIDGLTSSSLKKILKLNTGIYVVGDIIGEDTDIELTPAEDKLVNLMKDLQTVLIGSMAFAEQEGE